MGTRDTEAGAFAADRQKRYGDGTSIEKLICAGLEGFCSLYPQKVLSVATVPISYRVSPQGYDHRPSL